MTIPIIPGPFSFLASGGQALGAIGQGLTQRNVHQQEQAQQNAQLLSSLIAKGLVAPEALASPETHALFAQAGLPPINPAQVEISPELSKARVGRREAANIEPGTTAAQLYGGTPTTADVSGVGAKTAENQATSLALQDITKPQAQVKAGVPSETVAPLVQGAQAAAARQQTTESEGMQQIWQNVQAELPKDKQFSTVANYAAVHGLGFLTSQNEMYARLGIERSAENKERIRLITTVHNDASRSYDDATRLWAKSMQDEIDRQLNPLGPAARMTPEEQAAIRNNIVQQYQQTKPQMKQFLDKAIEDYDSDRGEYNDAVKGIFGGTKGAEPKQDPISTLKSDRAAGHPGLSDDKIDAATALTAEQKAELKKIPYGKKKGTVTTPGGARY